MAMFHVHVHVHSHATLALLASPSPGTLAWRYECSVWKRLHLLYHMTISLQWPLWMVWYLMMPVLAASYAQRGAGHLPTHVHAELNLRGALPTYFSESAAPISPASIDDVRQEAYRVLFIGLGLVMLLASAIAALELRHSYTRAFRLPAWACVFAFRMRTRHDCAMTAP